ncbi:MAG: hypothetical protein KJN60_03210 [Boseongicola sp.]|nr:hypothetical protein [Boseongicola sp.]
MNVQNDLIARNSKFAATFDKPDMPVLPRLRTVLLACADARVDPAHVLGLDLGEVIVIRNTGGRVTRSVIEELATLSVLANILTEGREQGFNVILMQHTQCGAQRLANPELQAHLKDSLGIDVSDYAITDQASDLMIDVGRLVTASEIPDAVTVSALLYDVVTGVAEEIASVKSLGEWRSDPVTPGVDKAS